MTQLPTTLIPSATLPLATPKGLLDVPLTRPYFTPAAVTEGVHTWGGKALLQVDDRAQFAEVAILRLFEEAGWECRWVETYGKPNMLPGHWRAWDPNGPSAQVHIPIEEAWVNEKLHAIAEANGNSYAGCWDVVAWKNDRLVFAEAKLQKKDKMRPTQLRWLEAALKSGCAVEDFLVVEWTLS